MGAWSAAAASVALVTMVEEMELRPGRLTMTLTTWMLWSERPRCLEERFLTRELRPPDATPGDSLCPELLAPTPPPPPPPPPPPQLPSRDRFRPPIATVPPVATMPPQMAAGAPSCPSGLESSTTAAAGANEGGELQTGQHVQVVGFQKSHTELNGRVGVVTGYDAAKGKYRVRMGPSQVLAFKRSNLVPSTSAE